MQEIKDEVLPQVEVVAEVKATAMDELVALYCSYKNPEAVGNDYLEVAKGGEKFFKLRAGQFYRMKRGTAQWHISRASRYDETNPLTLSIKTIDEIDALKAAAEAKKHARADAEAQAAKAAKEAQDKLEAEAATAAKLRRSLIDAAIGAGVIKESHEADGLTNDDLAAHTAAAKKP